MAQWNGLYRTRRSGDDGVIYQSDSATRFHCIQKSVLVFATSSQRFDCVTARRRRHRSIKGDREYFFLLLTNERAPARHREQCVMDRLTARTGREIHTYLVIVFGSGGESRGRCYRGPAFHGDPSRGRSAMHISPLFHAIPGIEYRSVITISLDRLLGHKVIHVLWTGACIRFKCRKVRPPRPRPLSKKWIIARRHHHKPQSAVCIEWHEPLWYHCRSSPWSIGTTRRQRNAHAPHYKNHSDL